MHVEQVRHHLIHIIIWTSNTNVHSYMVSFLWTSHTHRVEKDDIGIVDFPQHLMNASVSTAGSVHEYDEHHWIHYQQ